MADQRNDIAALFSANLRHHRKRLGISQERLAYLAGLHRTEIGHLENARRVPGIDTVIKLACSLLIEPGELLKGTTWLPSTDRPGGEFHCEDPRRLSPSMKRQPGPRPNPLD